MALTPEEMYENEKRWIQESYLKSAAEHTVVVGFSFG